MSKFPHNIYGANAAFLVAAGRKTASCVTATQRRRYHFGTKCDKIVCRTINEYHNAVICRMPAVSRL